VHSQHQCKHLLILWFTEHCQFFRSSSVHLAASCELPEFEPHPDVRIRLEHYMSVVFLISPCWFRNLRESLTTSDQFFKQTFRAVDFGSSMGSFRYLPFRHICCTTSSLYWH